MTLPRGCATSCRSTTTGAGQLADRTPVPGRDRRPYSSHCPSPPRLLPLVTLPSVTALSAPLAQPYVLLIVRWAVPGPRRLRSSTEPGSSLLLLPPPRLIVHHSTSPSALRYFPASTLVLHHYRAHSSGLHPPTWGRFAVAVPAPSPARPTSCPTYSPSARPPRLVEMIADDGSRAPQRRPYRRGRARDDRRRAKRGRRRSDLRPGPSLLPPTTGLWVSRLTCPGRCARPDEVG